MRAWLRPPRRVLLLLVASALALVAPMLRAASCPVAADLGRGVVLTHTAPPLTVTVRRVAGKLVGVVHTLGPPPRKGMARRYIDYPDLSKPPVPVTYPYGASLADGGGLLPMAFQYDVDMTPLLNIRTLRHFEARVRLTVQGAAFGTGVVTWDYVGADRITIGTCSYDVEKVRETLSQAQGRETVWLKAFAPMLGFVVTTATEVVMGQKFADKASVFDSITLAPSP